MPTQSLPNNPSLENLRKQAKTLRKSVAAQQPEALAQVREFHPRPDESSQHFSLSDAQLVIARSYRFASWAKLKQHLAARAEYSWSEPRDATPVDQTQTIVDRFISLACLTYLADQTQRRDQARALLAENPSLSSENIFAAATVGDVAAVGQWLDKNPRLAVARGGPRRWEPLLYAAYSRLNSEATGHSTLEAAQLLLKHGADPNAGFLWDGEYLFTALTGIFGEGESGPVNQPPHQYCYQLARVLLEAGAEANDSQTLYNRMFTRGASHLELLFEFGLGQGDGGVWHRRLGQQGSTPAQMLEDQLGWAAHHDHFDRVELLVAHGVDVNSTHNRLHRSPYEIALASGNKRIAEFLLAHGATRTLLGDLEAFTAACLAADADNARSLLVKDATLMQQLGKHRPELLNLAATENKLDAVRLMAGLGFDVNEFNRTAALHQAAWSGHLEMVKLLIELGADPLLRDAEHSGTPLGWARYNHQEEVAVFLEQFEPQASLP